MAALLRSRKISTTLLTNLLHSPPTRYFSTSTSSSTDKTISKMSHHVPCSLILASSDMKVGSVVHNLHPGTQLSNPSLNLNMDISSQNGSCMPISMMRIGTLIHNIEMRPGQGGKLVRAAGTAAKILKEPALGKQVLVRLPSGREKLVDTECRATIGRVGNGDHGLRKLEKAGRSRWLGRRPVVRGVAMNPVDHPHGGGEGTSKSSGSHGGVSRTPWGKPTKSGYKTGPLKRKK